MSELERMELFKEQSQQLGNFLEWLMSKYSLFRKDAARDNLFQNISNGDYIVIEKLLAEYFVIDLQQVEKEKQGILNAIKNPESGKCRCCGKDTGKDKLQVCDKCASEFEI